VRGHARLGRAGDLDVTPLQPRRRRRHLPGAVHEVLVGPCLEAPARAEQRPPTCAEPLVRDGEQPSFVRAEQLVEGGLVVGTQPRGRHPHRRAHATAPVAAGTATALCRASPRSIRRNWSPKNVPMRG
jgi:hypothetical protein